MNAFIENPKEALAYARWSSDEQTGGSTLERQMAYTHRVCKENNLSLKKIYIDEGVSAYTGENLKPNSQLSKLLAELKPNTTIIIENGDRLTRKGLYTAMDLLKRMTDNQCSVILNNVKLDATNFDKDINSVFSTIRANEEISRRSDMIRKGFDRQRKDLKEGRYVHINHLPPWIKHGDHCYELIPEKVELVRRMFSMYNKGMGVNKIAAILNSENVPPLWPNWYNCGIDAKRKKIGQDRRRRKDRQFKGWWPATISSVLRNKAAIGYCCFVNPPVKLFPPIIDENTFYSAATSLAQRKTNKGKRGARIALYGPLLQCSKCESGMIRHAAKRIQYYYYECSNWRRGLCSVGSIRGDWLDKSFQNLVSRSSVIASTLINDKPVSPDKLEVLKAKLSECQSQQKKITQLIIKDPTPSPNLYSVLKGYEAEETTLLQDIDNETALIKGHTPVQDAIENYNKVFKDKWNDPEARLAIRECLKSFIEKIVVDRDNNCYDVYFKNGRKPIHVQLFKDHCEFNSIEYPYNN